MVRTNLQEFVGDVHVLSNLQVGSNLFANDLAANVLTVDGSIGSTFFIGDGGLLSNIATTLNDIVANPGGNTVSNTLVFESGADVTSNTAIATLSNVGISISNTEPTGEFQFAVGSNIFVNTHASNVLTVVGAIGSDLFIGDGGLLSNIATTIDQIIDQGNTVSNTLIFESGIDATSNTGIVTKKDVGISVSNTEPTGEFQFGVGSNLLVNVYSSNVLAIEGNVSAEKMTLGTITVTSAYGLNHVTAQGSVTGDTISLTNATTGLAVTSNATVGGNVTAETVITSANVEVGDRLKFASNVFVDDLRVADLAANLVTYDKTTGELMDSGGLFANKLAVVSVQPPSALSANVTTVAKHGTYTVTTSSLAAYSNAWNAFDGDSAVEWLGSTTIDHVYNGGGYTYSGTSNLFAGNYIQTGASSAGEWLAIEFPYKTTLRHMKLTPPTTYEQYPASANVYATNDSLTWTELTNWSGVDPGDQQSNVQTIIVNATESFKKYAMVVTKTTGSDTNTALAEWKLFTESFSIDGGKVEMASSAVMGGETTMEQSGPHRRNPKAVPLKKYPEIIFEEGKFDKDEGDTSSNTYIQAGYIARASSHVPTSDGEFDERQVWRLFDGLRANATDHEGWMARGGSYEATGLPTAASPTRFTGDQGQWAEIGLPHKIKLQRFSIAPGNNNNSLGAGQARFPKVIAIHGYDGSSWTRLQEFTTTQVQSLNETQTFEITTPTGYHEKFVLVVKQTWTADVASNSSLTNFDEWKLYGYEELATEGDTSVDTTFTSIMNTPQTTGAQVYVDGSLGETFTNRVTGPTPTGTATSYDSTGKYWELTGALESNVTLEANTFLEGDQPHAVSVWFNSSNLEANVSNTCVFSVSDQEKLDSLNLDLQSNTWHNLTYAYQGEGGSRVTYLDGRKVAEDQAEDTFGKYPPFAMTGYSQGGYVVSASSVAPSTGREAWKAFDNDNTTHFEGNWSVVHYEANTGDVDGDQATTTNVDGSGIYQGEWIQIEFPHKIVTSYYELRNRVNMGYRMPENAKLLGSNDGISWTTVYNHSDTGGVYTAAGETRSFGVGSNRAYKYFRLVTNKLFTNTSSSASDTPNIATWKLYGHRENDLVRLPDPTNVLKYPHIAMTGPAQRGYVASASSLYLSGGEAIYPAWEAFDHNTSANNRWASENAQNYNGDSFLYSGNKNLGTNNGGSGTPNGEWLMIEMPHKIKLQSTKLIANGNALEVPDNFIIYGSNDLTGAWSVVDNTYETTSAAIPYGETGKTWTVSTSASPVAYKYFGLVVRNTTGSTYITTVNEWELYGTGVDSIPIQIGGGNIDKVANFRVYDKFVGEDQALEIWDAQKDTFRGVKNSVTLHKGRLGIGTTEPEGRLAVLDEPHGLEEFPPRAMTGYENYFEGHGEFCVSASVDYGSNNYRSWNAFDKLNTSWNGGWTTHNYTWDTNGSLLPDTSNVVTFDGVQCHWVALELPYAVKPDHVTLLPRVDGSVPTEVPGKGRIYGSKDGVTWDQIRTYNIRGEVSTLNTLMGNTPISIPLTTINYYKHLLLTVEERFGGSVGSPSWTSIGQLRYFGTREQGQSVLHDGQLTLTKSLNVPRIGPALDADDTPRRDRLVVEYNTSTNPTFEGAVRDTSGRGNDGVFYGGASYDATEKAFEFDGDGDYIQKNLNNQGDFNFTVSCWFKRNSDASTMDIWFMGGNSTANPGNGTGLQFVSSGTGYFYFFNGRLLIDTTLGSAIGVGKWNNVICTRDGNTQKLYLNGVDRNITQTGTNGLSLRPNTLLSIGGRPFTDENYFDGSLSNFKLYDTALTASEVKTLYDMGRCDEGGHVVNFSKTRVGIGLGDGEAPRGALDVRDEVYINKQVGPLELRQIVDNVPLQSFIIKAATPGFGYWGMYVTAGNDFSFHRNGSDRGYLPGSTNVGAIDFTGQHRSFVDGIPYGEYQTLEGLIVSANKNKYYDIDENITAGINAIQISQSLPLVALSNVANDKACFGVISGVEDPDKRTYDQGSFVSVIPKQKGDTRAFINSVGEGAIWVSNIGGNLESGDYITTSNVAGYGQKQDGAGLMNYTVAKITMDCDFNPATQPVQQILRSNVIQTYYLGNVHKVKTVPHEFVTTTVGADDTWSNVSVSPSDVTYAEWSNLEANTQNTYTLTYTQTSNVVYDVKYTLTTTANVTESDPWDSVFVDPPDVTYAEYSNLEANTQSSYSLTFTKTTTDEKTPEEWSALESNTQSLYNTVYYQSVEEEVASDYPGAVAHTRVTDVIENELDEYGQIQWEDHPTETEKAYKIRYLDVSGAQTDEANAVHIAAFVGCTYHCG